MRAAVIEDFGEPDVFRLAEIDTPAPGPGQVLVRIAAASVNPVDYKLRGKGPPIAPELPAVLGCDMAGTVEAVGPGVTEFATGDRVYGCVGGVRGMPGTYAEYVAADVRLLAPAPRGLSLREAAALPLVTITAWEGLLLRAGLRPGMQVLIHGGTGGVGHAAVQIARAHGATVSTTVSSGQKAAVARRLGAHQTAQYTREPVEEYVERLTGGEGFDLVMDATGGSDLPTSFAAARLNGSVVTIVSQYSADLSLMHQRGLSLHVVFMLIPMLHDRGREVHADILRQASELVAQGRLRPLVDGREFTLETLADAHRYAEEGHQTGKVVISIDPVQLETPRGRG